MSGYQTIDETLSRNLRDILRPDDLRKIARNTSYSIEFVRLLLKGDRSLTAENRVILVEAKCIARRRALRYQETFIADSSIH